MPDIQVLGVVANRPAAERVVGNLRLAGFSQRAVELVVIRRGQSDNLENITDQHGEGSASVAGGALKGASIGAAIGLVGGIATLFIPGLQILSPVIMIVLFFFTGAFVGALAGAFGSEEESDQIIERYGMALREGQGVIIVTAPNADRAKRAEELLTRAGAANVNSYLAEAGDVAQSPGLKKIPQ
jgi:hypothetical protein